MSVYESVGKRALDVAGAIVALPILGAVTVVVAPIIKLSDGGPVFFLGERRGRSGQHFTMYKFRSMRVNAPDLRNSDLSTVNSDSDPRVTRIGRILRATSLDELPQILNVLKGDMSFVGPRPNMTTQTWDELTDLERKRLRVRPGITGLAQASRRNAATSIEKYEIDEYYVDNLSMLLDLRVIGETISAVVASRNINAPSERSNTDD
ncbi:Sugar transferase involved in LPS biosynthesis (colanic, teichoic acid) [Ruaniaceae bacterium KH17]|nr:Sugar transferase involved in LPS biosynthesis (colanic, teichoic acid) [Ruaniaceae bacterium KH17]